MIFREMYLLERSLLSHQRRRLCRWCLLRQRLSALEPRRWACPSILFRCKVLGLLVVRWSNGPPCELRFVVGVCVPDLRRYDAAVTLSTQQPVASCPNGSDLSAPFLCVGAWSAWITRVSVRCLSESCGSPLSWWWLCSNFLSCKWIGFSFQIVLWFKVLSLSRCTQIWSIASVLYRLSGEDEIGLHWHRSCQICD